MIALRKTIKVVKGQARLEDETRYFFYITNVKGLNAPQVVQGSNERCNQENLIAQLAGGVRALSAPVPSRCRPGSVCLRSNRIRSAPSATACRYFSPTM